MDILKNLTDNMGKLEEVKKLAAQYGVKEEDIAKVVSEITKFAGSNLDMDKVKEFLEKNFKKA